ncbi:hypothetical protein HYR99_09415 [Candidatus Poribacteria bacterium]|nr:hypothetical protein [Candidatus Poribacteria bacterium]
MKRIAIASLWVAVLLFLYGCNQAQKGSAAAVKGASAEKPASPALETVALEVDGMT